ncbi:D-alanyl-D-alanine carboxypeptidase family protein [Streptomyces paradoxus]|uniref:D-alanyl-D-alanine carboxypeptidase family protein n=1 Tax=Streptomyces paradoxus TaxID=66375 RepID=UPI00380B8005
MCDSARLSRRTLLALAVAAPASGTRPVLGGDRLGRDAVQAGSTAGLPRRLTARSWLVADHDTGRVLAAYRAHRRLPPASTLKMLFADTLLDRFPRGSRHTVTAADLAGIPVGSSLVGIRAGTTYTVDQLWQGVFLRSGNDAVHVLAHMNGGVARTVAEMRARARQLRALDTHVVSPDGFDHPGQVSSAYDLTLFARQGLRDPRWARWSSRWARDTGRRRHPRADPAPAGRSRAAPSRVGPRRGGWWKAPEPRSR